MQELYVVVPVYQSTQSLSGLVQQCEDALKSESINWSILFVDDRSPNNSSWEHIQALCAKYPNVGGLRLLKNRGRASAVFCGLDFVARHMPDALVVIMDDDLQHSPADIPKLLDLLASNPEVDVAVAQFPTKRHSALARAGSFIKSKIDRHYYGLPAEIRMSSFVAVRPTVVSALAANRSTFPLVGPQLIQAAGRVSGVDCTHHPRRDGDSTFTFAKRLSQFLRIFLSDTILLLKFFTRLGILISCASMAFAAYFVALRIFVGAIPEGWASLFVATSFLGGVNMILLGLIGINLIRTKQTAENFPAWHLRESSGMAQTADERSAPTTAKLAVVRRKV